MKVKLGSTQITAIVISVVCAVPLVWAAIGGPVSTYDDTKTAIPRQLGKNPAPGRVLQMPTGTDQRGAYWVDNSTGLPSGDPGQVAGVVSLTGTRTVVTTGTQTSVATETFVYTYSVTGTTTGTITATGATGTYTYTGTGTATGMSTSGSVSVQSQPYGIAMSVYYSHAMLTTLSGLKFQTIDTATPSSLSVLDTQTICSSARAIVPSQSGAITACDNGHVYFWDCNSSGVCSVHYDASTGIGAGTYAIAQYGTVLTGYLLLANSIDNNVQVMDKSSATIAGTISTGASSAPTGIGVLSSTLAVVALSGTNRVYAVDYSTPSSPTLRGYVSASTPYGVYTWGGRYAAIANSSSNQVTIVDFVNPDSPSIIGTVDTGSSTGPLAIAGSGAFIYVTLTTSGAVMAINISDPSSPVNSGTISVGTSPKGIAVAWPWAFVALYGDNAVKSIDISRFVTSVGTQTTTNTMTTTGTVTNTQSTTSTATQTYAATGTYTYSTTSTGTTTGTEWKAVNGTLYAGSNVRLSKGTSTVTDTAVTMEDKPTIHAVTPAAPVPGGDLFMYAYSGCNTIAVFETPNSTLSGDISVTATTAPTYFGWYGTEAYYTAVVNRFEDDCAEASTARKWISAGAITYTFQMKASSLVTAHAVFGICSNKNTLSSTIQDVSFAVTTTDWSAYTGTVAIPSGVLVPSGSALCLGVYVQTSSGTATAYLGTSYANQSRLNGPWIKSGANARP